MEKTRISQKVQGLERDMEDVSSSSFFLNLCMGNKLAMISDLHYVQYVFSIITWYGHYPLHNPPSLQVFANLSYNSNGTVNCRFNEF